MKVHWTNRAKGICFLSLNILHQTRYAQKMIDKLTKRSEQIAMFPMSGRMVPEYGNQEIKK
jgi:hypothetical protein